MTEDKQGSIDVTIKGEGKGFAYFCVTQSEDSEKCLCTRAFPDGMSDETAQQAVQAMALYAIKMLPITSVLEAAINQLTDGNS